VTQALDRPRLMPGCGTLTARFPQRTRRSVVQIARAAEARLSLCNGTAVGCKAGDRESWHRREGGVVAEGGCGFWSYGRRCRHL